MMFCNTERGLFSFLACFADLLWGGLKKYENLDIKTEGHSTFQAVS